MTADARIGDPVSGPRVSVVVPTYNHAATIPLCIDALLAQDFPRDQYEVIFVDDGSADGTAGVVAGYAARDPRIRYVHQVNRGPAAARNRGAQEARGSILVFTDDDCVAEPTWLSEMVKPLEIRWLRIGMEIEGEGELFALVERAVRRPQ